MYRVSLLPNKVLITTDEVIALGPVDGTVDPRNLLQAIQIAEERFIKPAICKELYYDLRDKKNIVVADVNKTDLQTKVQGSQTAPVTLVVGQIVNAVEFMTPSAPYYVELWNEYLWKICAEAVVYIASPTNYSRFTAAGEMENNPKTILNEGGGSNTVDLNKMKWKMDKLLMDRIDPLIEAMHDWLCDNKDKFPLYKCKQCNNAVDGVSINRKTPWVHGIYGNNRILNSIDSDRPENNCNESWED